MTFQESIKFVTVDINYIQFLYSHDTEVQYQPYGYENKPYLGILMTTGNATYAIPLTSAKSKHLTLPLVGEYHLVVNEVCNLSALSSKDIWLDISEDLSNPSRLVRHYLSVVDCRKMIPIREGLFSFVDIQERDTDDNDLKKYKLLLRKEYDFCVSHKQDIELKASNLYSKQLVSGRVVFKCCNFALLEALSKSYQQNLTQD